MHIMCHSINRNQSIKLTNGAGGNDGDIVGLAVIGALLTIGAFVTGRNGANVVLGDIGDID